MCVRAGQADLQGLDPPLPTGSFARLLISPQKAFQDMIISLGGNSFRPGVYDPTQPLTPPVGASRQDGRISPTTLPEPVGPVQTGQRLLWNPRERKGSMRRPSMPYSGQGAYQRDSIGSIPEQYSPDPRSYASSSHSQYTSPVDQHFQPSPNHRMLPRRDTTSSQELSPIDRRNTGLQSSPGPMYPPLSAQSSHHSSTEPSPFVNNSNYLSSPDARRESINTPFTSPYIQASHNASAGSTTVSLGQNDLRVATVYAFCPPNCIASLTNPAFSDPTTASCSVPTSSSPPSPTTSAASPGKSSIPPSPSTTKVRLSLPFSNPLTRPSP